MHFLLVNCYRNLIYGLYTSAPATLKQLEETFKAPVIEAYAMTEAAHQMTANSLPPGSRLAGSVGKGKGVDVLIMDEHGGVLPASVTGEVCVKGKNVIRGMCYASIFL
jgi:acyl-CoA synthetase (AMP-forming)/AMP-acid ligase II